MNVCLWKLHRRTRSHAWGGRVGCAMFGDEGTLHYLCIGGTEGGGEHALCARILDEKTVTDKPAQIDAPVCERCLARSG